jgi:hypothetical protein
VREGDAEEHAPIRHTFAPGSSATWLWERGTFKKIGLRYLVAICFVIAVISTPLPFSILLFGGHLFAL